MTTSLKEKVKWTGPDIYFLLYLSFLIRFLVFFSDHRLISDVLNGTTTGTDVKAKTERTSNRGAPSMLSSNKIRSLGTFLQIDKTLE